MDLIFWVAPMELQNHFLAIFYKQVVPDGTFNKIKHVRVLSINRMPT
jgi:hypothetical protein